MTVSIDFGTSNCTAGFMRDGKPFLVELEEGSILMPTVVYVEKVKVKSLPVHDGMYKSRIKHEKRVFTEEVYADLLGEE